MRIRVVDEATQRELRSPSHVIGDWHLSLVDAADWAGEAGQAAEGDEIVLLAGELEVPAVITEIRRRDGIISVIA